MQMNSFEPRYFGYADSSCIKNYSNEDKSNFKTYDEANNKNNNIININLNEFHHIRQPQFIRSYNINITIKNINVNTHIQIAGDSIITADNCSFIPYDIDCKSFFEIKDNSKCIFNNCFFSKAIKTAVTVSNKSEAYFTNCQFESFNTSIQLLNQSYANINSCQFHRTERYSIYLSDSSSTITDCQFFKQKENAIYLLRNSKVKISNCKFKDCDGGGIIASDSSIIHVNECEFFNLSSSCISLWKNSIAYIMKCDMKNISRNGIIFHNSTGEVSQCSFDNFSCPAIVCSGENTNPKITNSEINNIDSISIVSGNHAKPHFSNIKMSNIKLSCFLISDFSNLTINNCSFTNVGNLYNIHNNGQVSIDKCTIHDNLNENNEVDQFKNRSPTYHMTEETFVNEEQEEKNDENEDHFDLDLKNEVINRLNQWLNYYKQKSKKEESFENFCYEFRSFLTEMVSDFKLNLARIAYLLINDESIKKHKKCPIDEIREYFSEKNYEDFTDYSKKIMEELIDKIKDNIENVDYSSVYWLQVSVLQIFVFRCLYNPNIKTVESCSNIGSDLYWISYYIQLDDTINLQNHLLEELDLYQ